MTTINTKNVFVVEDSGPVRVRLIEMLNDIQDVCVIGEAESPELAVSGIVRTLPDYVVLDFQLKGGTGAQVLHAVRAHVPKTIFIVLTNHSELPFRQLCIEAGADAFFDKTSEIGKMKEMIANTESRRQQPY
jgi:DNA-binding NarL/FixJ family response regulator